MIRNTIAIILLTYLFVLNSFAEQALDIDLSAIAALEREQIIKELSYRLDTKQNCNATPSWDDAGSGADLDGFFFIPKVSSGEYIIGGHASQKRRSKHHCVLTVSEPANNPKGAPPLLVAPKDWQRLWTDKGSGAAKDGSFWQAIPPDNNYTCIGTIPQIGHGQKPNLSNYRCVHNSLVEKSTVKNLVWSDKGSGANSQVSVFQLLVSGAFTVVPNRANQLEAADLRKNLSGVPDTKTVDAILAQRMEKIRADIEAEEKARLAEKQKQAEAQRLKEETEKKRLAEAAEKKRKAEEAERKQKAEEAEKQRLAELEQQQETQLAQVEEKAEPTKPEPVKEEKQQTTTEVETELPDLIDDSDPFFSDDPFAEETTAAEATETETTDTEAAPVVSPIKETKAASGLDKLVTTFLKILGIMIGGLIFIIIVFKLAFGSKSKEE